MPANVSTLPIPRDSNVVLSKFLVVVLIGTFTYCLKRNYGRVFREIVAHRNTGPTLGSLEPHGMCLPLLLILAAYPGH